MAVIVEDGVGRLDADSFVSLEDADAYWAGRPQAPLAPGWEAASEALREGALREAARHLCQVWGTRFSGTPTYGRGQALCWPRRGAMDRSGETLEQDVVPREVIAACCELAARALVAPLSDDLPRGGQVREEEVRVDAVTTRTVYATGAPPGDRLPVVDGLLAPLLRGAAGRLMRG